ncbi:MAG: carbohydrate ABC transporter permease, partial [Bifidobacteriales bacterium]|nr:carbohydrate ABC transporter permease [Bifidobacteriales bacterium]
MLKEKDAARRIAQPHRVGSNLLLIVCIIYFLMPVWWLVVAATKSNSGLFMGTGGSLWFDKHFALFDNIKELSTYEGGIYWRWLLNSFLYAFVGGLGATIISVMAGYGFAKFRFAGRNAYFDIVLGALMIPTTALVIPTFILMSQIGMNDTLWAVLLPSLLSPFGTYLMRVYCTGSLPDEMLEAARVDGAGEIRTFIQVALP